MAVTAFSSHTRKYVRTEARTSEQAHDRYTRCPRQPSHEASDSAYLKVCAPMAGLRTHGQPGGGHHPGVYWPSLPRRTHVQCVTRGPRQYPAGDGGRSRLPLRGRPSITPGSLLPPDSRVAAEKPSAPNTLQVGDRPRRTVCLGRRHELVYRLWPDQPRPPVAAEHRPWVERVMRPANGRVAGMVDSSVTLGFAGLQWTCRRRSIPP